MKKNCITRFLALVMAIVMLLGTCSTALADFTIASYDAALKKAVDAYYAELMAATDYHEVWNIFVTMTEDEYDAFSVLVTGDERTALEEHITTLFEAYVANLREAPIVTRYTRVAPFLNASSTASVSAYSARSLASSPTARVGEATTLVDNSNIVTDKTVSDPVDGVYTITLKTYVTGAKTTTTVTKVMPTDIVLVLDQSGSMAYCIGCGKEISTEGQTHTLTGENATATAVNGTRWDTGDRWDPYRYGFQSTETSYYILVNGEYQRVYRSGQADNSGYYRYYYGNGNNRTYVYPILDQDYGVDRVHTNTQVVQFYVMGQELCSSRYDALKTAVTNFTAAVKEKTYGSDGTAGTADDVHHRVALVGFASESGDGNNTEILTATGRNSGSVGVRYNGNGYNTAVQNALQDMSTTAGQTMVTNAINALATEGATRSDLGMKMAVDIFEDAPAGADVDENGNALARKQIVIMFTDGSPTSYQDFNSSVATGAISNAKTLKDDGVTVYTVGVFEGANADKLSEQTSPSNENKYMHYTSSNFENATSFTSPGTATYPATGSYYLSASSSSDLNSIFTGISDQVTTGGTSVTLEETTVIKDIVADSFQLPAGADASAIKVFTEDYTAENTFTNKQEVTQSVNVSVSNDTISVYGFDYGDNWVGKETTDGKVTYRGKRLLIEIPIVVKPDFLGGNHVPTNGNSSGIYSADGTLLENYVRPDVDITVETVKPNVSAVVEVVDQHIYLTNDAALAELVVGLGKYKIDGKLYTVDGTNNKYVDLIYEIKDGNTVVGTYTIAAGQTTGAWVEAADQDMTPALTDDKTYTVVCTVHPISTGTYDDVDDDATVAVYVYKPQLTFNDSEIQYNQTVPDRTKEGYAANGGEEVWLRKDGTASTAEGITMRGTKPKLELVYTPDESKITDGKFTATDFVAVNVTVNLDDGNSATENAKFPGTVTFLHEECKVVTACQWGTVGSATGTPAFLLHVTTGELTITKMLDDAAIASGEFEFVVTPNDVKLPATLSVTGDGTATIANGVANVKLTVNHDSSASITIKNLPAGNYTVAEQGAENYTTTVTGGTVNGKSSSVDVPAGGNAAVSFTNIRKLGNLKISKTVQGEYAPDSTFTFQTTLTNAGNVTYSYKVYNTANNTEVANSAGTIGGSLDTISLKDGQYALITGIPQGAQYSVQEVGIPTGFEVTPTAASGNISAAAVAEAAFTNVHQVGSLTINKTVDGTAEDGQRFLFKVTNAENEQVAEVILAAGGSITLDNLPIGYYTVTEDTNWSARYTVNEGTQTKAVTLNGNTQFSFVNTKKNDQWLDANAGVRNDFENDKTYPY